MKLKKGTLLFILLTCLAYTTLAQEVGYELKNTDVDIDDNGKITNYKSSNTNIIIPIKIGDITITEIGSDVFKQKNLVAVAFAADSEVTTIGASAFQNNQITALTLPTTLASIGADAFSGNTGLTITLPEHAKGADVTYKDSNNQVYDPNDENKNTFTNFDRSLAIVIPPFYTLKEGDVTVDDQGIITVCLRCKDFVSKRILIPVQIGDITITGIGSGAFKQKSLVAVAFAADSEVTTIGVHAFETNQITTLTLPASLTTIGAAAFFINSMTTLSLPKGLTTIGGFAFSGNQITELTIPNDSQLTTIEEGAFSGNQITELTLPEGLTTIGKDAFRINLIKELTFPENSQLTTIGNYAFWDNQITTLALPTTLTTIGIVAFSNNPLPSFTLPSVTIEGFRTYWQDGNSRDLGTNLTIPKADFGKSFKRISIQQFTLTTLVAGQQGGTITPVLNDGVVYDSGTKVELTANPQGRWRFDKWVITGGEDENGNPITVTVDADKTATAYFVEQVTLTLTIQGLGQVQGLNAGGNPIDKGTTTVLNAIPESGYRFVSWTIGKQTIQDNPYTLPASDTDISVTVAFELIPQDLQVTLTIAKEGEGTISPDEGANILEKDATATLTATPQDGWRFDKWVISDEEDKTDKTTTITLNQDKTVTAHFVQLVTLTVKVNNEDGGSIAPSDDRFVIDKADPPSTQELTATPNDGWRFDKWVIGSEERTDKTTTITLNQDKTATAHFVEAVTLTVKVNNEDGGSIAPSDDRFVIDKADPPSTQELTATPNDGWRFDKWVIGSEERTDKTTTITLNQDKTVTAHFVQLVTLTTAVAEQQGGTIAQSVKPNNDGEYDIKTEVTLTATPADGWKFDKWVIGTEERTDNPTSINLDGNKSATAHFVQLVTLTTSVEGQQGGSISRSPDMDTYNINTEVSLTATPADGWKFDKWVIGTEERTDNPTSINLDRNKSATAHFVEAVTLTVKVNNEDGGSIEPSDDRFVIDKADAPSTQALTAKPNEGWRFDKWVIGSEDITDNPTTITLDQDKTATAHFVEIVTLTVKVNNEEGGSIEPSDDHFVIDKADAPSTQALTAKPNEGWRFDKWVIGSEDITDNPTSINLDQDKTATAHFVEIVTLTVKVNNEDGGSIEPSDDRFVIDKADAPSTQELTAKPNEGWRFDKWVIGTEDITDNPTTITLDKNKSVTAHFVKEEEEEAITSILTEVVSATPYPNPVTSQITLKAKDGDLIQLFSPKGKQQYSAQHTGNEVHIIDVSTMPVGVYLVRITDAEGKTTTKRIVKK